MTLCSVETNKNPSQVQRLPRPPQQQGRCFFTQWRTLLMELLYVCKGNIFFGAKTRSSSWINSSYLFFCWLLLGHTPKAPAQTLQKHGEALQAELQCDPCEALHPSTISMMGRSKKNASRQYKRTVDRFGLKLNHGFVSIVMSCLVLFWTPAMWQCLVVMIVLSKCL